MTDDPIQETAQGPTAYITWYVRPEENAIWYNHYACIDGGRARWFVPLDDCPEPQPGETEECNECAMVAPLLHDALHDPSLRRS